MPHTPLTHDEAVQIARQFAASNDLPWEEDDLDVRLVNELIQVTTSASTLGGNLVVQLDPNTGAVRDHVYYWQ